MVDRDGDDMDGEYGKCGLVDHIVDGDDEVGDEAMDGSVSRRTVRGLRGILVFGFAPAASAQSIALSCSSDPDSALDSDSDDAKVGVVELADNDDRSELVDVGLPLSLWQSQSAVSPDSGMFLGVASAFGSISGNFVTRLCNRAGDGRKSSKVSVSGTGSIARTMPRAMLLDRWCFMCTDGDEKSRKKTIKCVLTRKRSRSVECDPVRHNAQLLFLRVG